jgi:hypothetical protein
MKLRQITTLVALIPLAAACGGSDGGGGDGGDGGAGAGNTGPDCTVSADCDGDNVCVEGTCGPKPAGWQIGIGDGTSLSVGVTFIYGPDFPKETTDLAFDPNQPNRLYVLHREYESQDPCGEEAATFEGCSSLEGSTAIIDNPGTDQVSVQVIQDDNALHFMRRPTGIAFSPTNGTFATCGEHRTGNATDDPTNYMGPTLWSTDLSVYGVTPPGGNGSHLDMLHATPYCMGAAAEVDNVYWFFNGMFGAIDRVDFKMDHGPGQDDHSDGEYLRYIEGQVARVPNVPSHLVFHDASKMLYIADTGNARVIRLDTTSGTPAGAMTPTFETLAVASDMEGATVEDVVPAGTLQQPSGLVIHDDVLFVSDMATSTLYAYDLDGNPLRSLQTELPPGSLTGLTIGPDELLYFADKPNGGVWRIEPIL